jgi:hypothetical protein
MSYTDVMKMPTYERRLFINIFKREMDNRQEQMENVKNSNSGKGKRTRRITGDEVKKYSGMS